MGVLARATKTPDIIALSLPLQRLSFPVRSSAILFDIVRNSFIWKVLHLNNSHGSRAPWAATNKSGPVYKSDGKGSGKRVRVVTAGRRDLFRDATRRRFDNHV